MKPNTYGLRHGTRISITGKDHKGIANITNNVESCLVSHTAIIKPMITYAALV